MNLAELLPSWELTLRAERKSPGTVKTYTTGVRRFIGWCQDRGAVPAFARPLVIAYVAESLETCEATTAGGRLLALKRFSAWALAEGEQDNDQLAAMKQPRLDSKVVEPLSDDDLRALLKTCAGNSFVDLRDAAILRFMIETGARANEVVSLETADVDLIEGRAIIRRGKGGKGRPVPFGPGTATAIDRYKRRARAKHSLAHLADLWLGARGKRFGYSALYLALTNRAKLAGIANFHPHRLRHTAAHRWLSKGGSDSGLMAVAGWSQPAMLQRYTRARASDRAAVEARTLGLGEL